MGGIAIRKDAMDPQFMQNLLKLGPVEIHDAGKFRVRLSLLNSYFQGSDGGFLTNRDNSPQRHNEHYSHARTNLHLLPKLRPLAILLSLSLRHCLMASKPCHLDPILRHCINNTEWTRKRLKS